MWFISLKIAEVTRPVITFYCTSLSGLVPEISHFKDFATIAVTMATLSYSYYIVFIVIV